MSIADEPMPDGGDDLLAAEFVLGALDADGRRAAARRIESEPDFARRVEQWEMHFAPLADAYEAAEPPAAVKAAIDRRIFATAAPPGPQRAGLLQSLALWRGLAAAAFAALLIAVAVPYLASRPEQPQTRLVASLAADGSEVRYLAVYDPGDGQLALSHVAGDRSAGRDFELWTIEGGDAPVSVGIVPAGPAVRLAVPPEARAKLAKGATLAISDEPAGGSPTGQPTGPVISAGDLFQL
ncbi:MAG: anti-sigma factor [Rhizobiaceae bacterium]|nr:anti-sigma factor [Rhizobiaceae bacterium]